MNWFRPLNLPPFQIISRLFGLLLLVCIGTSLSAQKTEKIEIVQANELVFTEQSGIKAQRLIGDVIFKHQNALMYCDSAYLYQGKNSIEAFGDIRINQGDTMNLYGDHLNYDGNTQIANVTGKEVRLSSTDFNLTTTSLLYNRTNNVADYYEGAVIESKNDSNILVSEIGHFFANESMFMFKRNVVLSNPNFEMNSDTLHYFTKSEKVKFIGPTSIKGDSNYIFCHNGWYDTKLDQSQYFDEAYIISENRKLLGDTLYYDRIIGYGQADGNISIIDTTEKIVLSGDHGEIYEFKDSAIVTENGLLNQIVEDDTLFIRADTFKIFKQNEMDFLMAYYHVLIFKSDLQGACDSVAYSFSDSTIQLYDEPVLWSDQNQLTAHRIDIRMANKNIHSLFLDSNAFIISEIDSIRYNQIKGKTMTGYFKNSSLSKVKVRGSGQTTYFGQDEAEKFIGCKCCGKYRPRHSNSGQHDTFHFISKRP